MNSIQQKTQLITQSQLLIATAILSRQWLCP